MPLSRPTSSPACIRPSSKNQIATVALLTLAGISFSGVAKAQVFGDQDSSFSSARWGWGLAATTTQQPYAGVDREVRAIPVLYAESQWLRLAGSNIDLKLWRSVVAPNQSVGVSLRVKYEDDGYEENDSSSLDGMDERKYLIGSGAAINWTTPWGQLSGEWVADLVNEGNGQKIQLQADRRIGLGFFGVTPRVRLQWLDERYVNYYYGVRAHEVTADRAYYKGESALAAEVGLRFDYVIDRNQLIFFDTSFTRLPNEIEASPIVERRNVSRLTGGYMYRF